MPKCYLHVLRFISFVAFLLAVSSSLALDLVRDGQPLAEIVVAESPARMTRLAARELQTYVRKISGATLPVVTEPSGVMSAQVYVGVSPHTERLGLQTNGLAYGAYRMASGTKWLALVGPDKDFMPVEPWGRSRTAEERVRVNRAWDAITGDTFWNPFDTLYMWHHQRLDYWEFDDRGTLNAVHDFLRSLGVRWYLPGALGEIVPERKTIALPAVDRTVRPDFPVRRLSWFYQSLPISEDDALWRLRLGLHNGHDVLGITQTVHGMKYVLMREEMKAAHPEYYTLRGGVRATGHKGGQGSPCLSSEELFRKHVAYARAVFDHFGEPALSIDMVDGIGAGVCECELCRGKGTPERGWGGAMSDYVFGYIDRVARELYKSHPDRMVTGITYGAYNLPPEKIDRMSPNFALCIIPHRPSLHDRRAWEEFDRNLTAWRAKLASGKLFTFSNIIYNWRGRGDAGPLLPVFFPRVIAAHLRSLKGVSSGEQIECYEHAPDFAQGWNAQAVAHLSLYVYSRFWWDADQDIEALLEEYYTLFYGPAREEMKTFIEYCEQNWPRMRNEVEPIDRAFELIAAAQAAVEPDSIYGQRVRMLSDYLELARPLREQLSREREGPDVRAPRRPAADIALDGRLDDRFWEGVPAFPLRERVNGTAAKVGTAVQLAWGDNNSLYLGVRCEEPDMAGIHDTADGGMGIFNGDCIDFLLETPVHSYYQVVVSPSGALFDMDRGRGFNTRWSSQASVAVHHGQDSWSLEIQLPAAGNDARDMDPDTGIAGVMPRDGAPWYFNLARSRPRDGGAEVTAFSPTGDRHFNDRFLFGRLEVGE